jgi:hypothetical protein
MSRIRTIKPEFWTSEQVVSCSPHARLLFIGLWNFCDDHGVHPASYIRLKAEIFPTDNFTIESIKCWMGELIQNELVREYSIENKSYWIVTGWGNHQRIDKPTYRHPLPLQNVRKISDDSWNIPGELVETSAIHRGADDGTSITDRNGKEGNEKDKDTGEVKASLVHVPDSIASANTNAIFSYWQNVMNHPHAKLDKKRSKKIEEALNLGYTPDELKLAIDGCSKTPFNTGQNDKGQRYDSIDLIFRDADHIDQFISNSINPPRPAVNGDSENNPMAGAL